MKNKKMLLMNGVAMIVFAALKNLDVITCFMFFYQPTLTEEMKKKIQSTR